MGSARRSSEIQFPPRIAATCSLVYPLSSKSGASFCKSAMVSMSSGTDCTPKPPSKSLPQLPLVHLFADLLSDLPVYFPHRVVRQLLRIHPAHLLDLQRSRRLAFRQVAQESVQRDAEMRICVLVYPKDFAHLDRCAQLLAYLALQAGRQVFSRLCLAARELPHAAQ